MKTFSRFGFEFRNSSKIVLILLSYEVDQMVSLLENRNTRVNAIKCFKLLSIIALWSLCPQKWIDEPENFERIHFTLLYNNIQSKSFSYTFASPNRNFYIINENKFLRTGIPSCSQVAYKIVKKIYSCTFSFFLIISSKTLAGVGRNSLKIDFFSRKLKEKGKRKRKERGEKRSGRKEKKRFIDFFVFFFYCFTFVEKNNSTLKNP